jgi:hypothetical protein
VAQRDCIADDVDDGGDDVDDGGDDVDDDDDDDDDDDEIVTVHYSKQGFIS